MSYKTLDSKQMQYIARELVDKYRYITVDALSEVIGNIVEKRLKALEKTVELLRGQVELLKDGSMSQQPQTRNLIDLSIPPQSHETDESSSEEERISVVQRRRDRKARMAARRSKQN